MAPSFPLTASPSKTSTATTPAQRAELDWLLYNKPLEDAQMVRKGEVEYYLSLGCDHGGLEDEVQHNNKSRQVFYKVGTCRDSFCLI